LRVRVDREIARRRDAEVGRETPGAELAATVEAILLLQLRARRSRRIRDADADQSQ
jgi:hypothetical protein